MSILTAASEWVAHISLNTLADTSVPSWCSEGVSSTGPLDAGVSAGVVGQLAVLDVNTVVIEPALEVGHTDSVLPEDHPRRTDALVSLRREDEASAGVTDALVADEDEAELGGTPDTDPLLVGVVTRRTDALVSLVQDEVPAWRAGRDGSALQGGVALVSLDTDADHGPHGDGVQHGALGVPAAGVGHAAGLGTVAVDAGKLTGAL